MGMVRVPLYTQKDRMGGLPNFLANSFVGTAKFQLLFALKILNMVPEEKLAEAVAATQKPKKAAIDHAGGAAGHHHLHGHKAGNELAKAGNELAERAEQAGAEHLVGLEGQALAEQLAGSEALEQPPGLGADAVAEQAVAEAME
ncbi:nudix hydrolase 16 like 1 [Willisornis vidua]|uniref:Nudix hydrolase 16 like 1 n=1 Tax=Willisornis vidua TaxID=1566151 RepID=A0ABQ9D6N7_9PASS|nr:nudix hydrolase 16 like 1 [Willisornis vidua]